MKKTKVTSVLAGIAMLACVLAGCDGANTHTYPTDIFTVGAAGSCGITLGDKFEKLTVFSEGSAGQITENADGSVTFVATAAGGGGGGAAFYMKSDKTEINLANYESIDLELVYSPVNGKWASGANYGYSIRNDYMSKLFAS